MMNLENMSPEDREKLNLAAGQCNFTCLFLFCSAAFCCGLTATSFCAFVSRDVTTTESAAAICESATNSTADQCESFFNNHGIGFWAWQATVPVDQLVCLSYTQYIESECIIARATRSKWNIIPLVDQAHTFCHVYTDVGYVTPTFDTNFNSARACSTTANFFGAMAFFTMAFSSCCPLNPGSMACLSIYFFMATLFQGLSLLIFRSSACGKGFFSGYFQNYPIDVDDVVESVSCSLSTGSKLAVAAIVLYFYCMLLVPKAVPLQPIGGNPFLQEGAQAPAGGDVAADAAEQGEGGAGTQAAS